MDFFESFGDCWKDADGSIVLYASRVNFFSVGVTDAHFKEFGNFVSESDTLKQFASKELLIPEDNFNNLGLCYMVLLS